MALADLQVLYTVYHLLYKYQYLTTKLQLYKLIKAQVKYVSQELVLVVLGHCKTLKHLASNTSICKKKSFASKSCLNVWPSTKMFLYFL